MHLRLPGTSPLILALGTWLIYVADRILDGLRINPSARLRERHLFYARNRRPILATAIAVALVLLWLIVARMNPSARGEDTALFAIALVYFCIIHVCGTAIERWFPKEAAVAVVFAAAVAIPAWSRLPEQRAQLVPLTAIFALICWLNCVAIEKWESTPLQRGFRIAPSHSTTRWTARHLGHVSSIITLLATLAALHSLPAQHAPSITALYAACAISGALFPLLDRSRLNSPQLRIAADAALLTPLLFIAVLR